MLSYENVGDRWEVPQIALLRDVPRVATVVAHSVFTTFEMDPGTLPDRGARACSPAARRQGFVKVSVTARD
jgi:hypothetical protein